MANTKYVTFAGDFMKKTEADILRPIEAVLENVGTAALEKMKTYTKPHDYRGDLSKSLMWRTKNNYSKVEEDDELIDEPPVHAVDIGSASDHAFVREYGSGPHLNPEGSEEFVNEIIVWAQKKGMTEDEAWAIIKTIRNEGTDEAPFVRPVSSQMRFIALPICREALSTYWAKQRQV